MMLRAAWARPALLLLAVALWQDAAAQNSFSAAANTAARAAIAACASRISDSPTGLPEIEKRCPELATALQLAEIRPLIIASSRDRLDRSSLQQLQLLLHPALASAPAVAKLGPILQGLQAGPVLSRPWWQRLWDWLIERLTHKQTAQSSRNWLEGLAQLLAGAQWLWKVVIWGTLIVLPVAVVIFVMREVRAMGERSQDEFATDPGKIAAGPVESRLALLRQAPLGQRPAQLFALLIARLVMAGRLPADRSLTHREVVRRAVLDDANQRRYIETLARLAERQLYAGVTTPPEGIEALLARGEDLYTTGWGRPVGIE